MRCETAKTQLYDNHDVDRQEFSDELLDHLNECRDCWMTARSLWESETSSVVCSAVPDQEILDDLLRQAWQVHAERQAGRSVNFLRGVAAAAILVLVAGVVMPQFWSDRSAVNNEGNTVIAAATEVSQLDFLFTSAMELDEATITLELDDNLALSGYPGMKKISWFTRISEGANQLSLPLLLQNENGGVIVVHVESAGLQKQAMFTVQSVNQQNSSQLI